MKRKIENIILCGFMATGKSTVGRALAEELGYEFLDLDDLITSVAGMPIPEIFARQGEPAFRELESRMAEEVSGRSRHVVATGGGTIVNRRNLEALQRTGLVVTLTANPETILSRVGSGEDRPMLWGGDKLEKIRALIAVRSEAYSRADLIVDTTDRSVAQIVQEIVDFLASNRFVTEIHPTA